MGLRDTLRRAAERFGRAISRDDLFEQPGERPSVGGLPPVPADLRPEGAAARVVTPLQAARARAESAAAAAVPAAEPVAAPAPVPAPAPEVVVAHEAAPAVVEAPGQGGSASSEVEPAARRGGRKRTATKTVADAPVVPSRPKDGCAPVDAAGLRAALAPAGRPLVVNHWATWCDPCVDELPRLVRAAAGVADIGEFLGVSWDLFDHPGNVQKRASEVARFADSVGVGYPSVLFTGTPEELFALTGFDWHFIPQTLVIAPDGRVVWHKKGTVDHDDVFPLIQAVKECIR